MAKAIFTTKVNPTYDDLPEVRYHFPRIYLNQVRSAAGDWIIYYEPRRQDADPGGRRGRQAYFAVARITAIDEDEIRRDHFYARISDYLEFERPVPFRERSGLYYESGLRRPDGASSKGAFGRAVRLLPDEEFEGILRAGFTTELELLGDARDARELSEESEKFVRPIREQLVRRPVRDWAFSVNVSRAYDYTCAVTALRIINGGGRPEIEAAHIRPVGGEHEGPDSIRNGVALSRTVHWMLDRGLIALSDDYEILMANRYLPEQAKTLIRRNRQMTLPAQPTHRPHPTFLRYHREHIFKG